MVGPSLKTQDGLWFERMQLSLPLTSLLSWLLAVRQMLRNHFEANFDSWSGSRLETNPVLAQAIEPQMFPFSWVVFRISGSGLEIFQPYYF